MGYPVGIGKNWIGLWQISWEPYLKDQSLVFRKAAEVSMYNKHYKKALANALLAIREVPSRLINYRLLIYVLRKSNLNLIK